MKVLFLASYYPNKFSGTGPFMREHANALAQHNEVIVIAIKDYLGTGAYTIEKSEASSQNLQEIIIYFNVQVSGWVPFKSLIRFFRMLIGVLHAKFLFARKTDWTLLNVVRPLGIVALIHRILGNKYSILEHSTGFIIDEYEQTSWTNKLFHKLVFKLSQEVICVSRFLGDGIVKNGLCKKYTVIPNVIDSRKFYPLKRENQKNDKPTRFIHISNYAGWKQVDQILRAFAQVTEVDDNFELILIGDGSELIRLKELASELKFTEKCHFLGYIPHDVLRDEINKSDVLVMNSLHETFCCVLYECISCGIPALMLKSGAISEYFKTDYGLLHTNQEELQLNIKYMMAHHPDYNASILHQHIKNSFDLPEISALFEKIIHK